MILIYLGSIWLAGIYIGTLIKLPPLFFLGGLIPLVGLVLARRYRKPIILASLGIFLFVGAAVYAYSSLYSVDENDIRVYNDSGAVEIKGMVSQMPDIRDKSARLTLAIAEIKLENGWQEAKGTVLAVVPRYPEYSYGDLLDVTGELQTPLTFEDFDYKGYLEHQGIYTTIYYPKAELLESGHGSPVLAWIYNLRANLAQKLAEALPEPQASLAQGILLGLRGNIPTDLNNDFKSSGTSHILAISGQNLAIMAGILLAIGLWLFGRRHYLYVWLALVVIWFYAIITGMSPPVVRSAIMASIFLFAEVLGRQRSSLGALVLTAAVMAGINPYILGDVSFQLSFAGIAGLIFIFPMLSDFGKRLITARAKNEGFVIKTVNAAIDIMSASLAATITTWPLLAYYYGFFSLPGPLATFFLTPVLPIIIILGSLTMLVGLASGTVAQVFGWVLWLLLSYMIALVRGFGGAANATLPVEWLSPGVIVAYYAVLALVVWLVNRWRGVHNLASGSAGLMKAGVDLFSGLTGKLKWLVIPLLIAAVLVSYTAAAMPDDKLRVSFLDVGQGDAILVQKGSRQVLIDGGPSPSVIAQELSDRMPFWDRSIDLAILTHPHVDHLAGLLEVLRRYNIGQVLYPPSQGDSTLYKEWVRFIGEVGVKGTVAQTGQRIDLGDGVSIEVLWPRATPLTDTDDAVHSNCVVLLLKIGKVNFLFTGDSTSNTEWELIRSRADIKGTVIKVAHHGSKTSSTSQFLSVVKPQSAVISVGDKNSYGLPKDEVLDRLMGWVGESYLYRTDTDGTITFITDGKRLWVEEEN